jgi:hypothetical protein
MPKHGWLVAASRCACAQTAPGRMNSPLRPQSRPMPHARLIPASVRLVPEANQDHLQMWEREGGRTALAPTHDRTEVVPIMFRVM